MRVGLYCDCNSRGGVWAYTTSLSRQLVRLGVEVHVLTHEPRNRLEMEIAEELRTAATPTWTVPEDRDRLQDARNFAGCIVSADLDIFVPNYRRTPYVAAAIASRQAQFAIAGVCHNDHESYYALLDRFQGVITGFVCATERTSIVLKERHLDRADDVAVIPHGIRFPEESCAPFTGGTIRLIYHGRLTEEQKRVGLILDVADRLIELDTPFELVLIGDGADAAKYRQRVRASRLTDHVTIESGQGWDGIVQRLLRSHLALLTSEYEGFCLSLAEAMGCALPGVAFRCGGVIEEYLEHGANGYLIDHGHIDDMAQTIARVQRNPPLWHELSQRAQSTIRGRFAWEPIARQYVDRFRAMRDSPRRPRWPALRPVWIPPARRSWRSTVERAGKILGAWR